MEYLIILTSIFFINVLLSGDNALVIALASRNLPTEHKRTAILFGSIGAVGLRIILSFLAVYLLTIPYLQLIGGFLLLWIAVKLISDEQEEEQEVAAKNTLWGAIQTIIIADLAMSLDNVIAIAGAAKGNLSLIIIGLAMSIPLIIWGSNLIGLLMKKWPIIITLGAAILGWTAGDMIVADKTVVSIAAFNEGLLSLLIPAVCTILVVVIGTFMSKQKNEKQ
ncbi:MAG: TerC family protein [Pelosinus sp.]|nr:TerC family protein [Pelosinus sp.]